MDLEKAKRAIRARHPEADVDTWLAKTHIDGFLAKKDALAQKIPDERAVAWYYDFDMNCAGMDAKAKEAALDREIASMARLSPYDVAIAASRLYGDGRFFSKSAETVAKEHRMIVPPSARVAKTNHLNLARSYMNDEAWKCAMKALPDSPIEMVGKYKYNSGDIPIQSTGLRYLFMEAGGRALPVLRVVGKEAAFDDYAMELGAMAAQSDDFAGGIIVSLDPETLFARAEFHGRDVLMPFRDQAQAAATEFMDRHIVRDVPIPFPKRDRKEGMDDGQAETFRDLARDAAYWSEVEKGAKERGEEARGRMAAFLETCASQAGVSAADINAPKELFTMRVKQSVDEDELAAILEEDGAREKIMGLKPNSKKMEKVLKKLKADKAEWCDEALDMKALAKFCEENGIEAAISQEVSFALNPKGDQEMKDTLAEAAARTIEKAQGRAPKAGM